MYADRIVHMLDGKITSIEDNRKNIIAVDAKDETENTEKGTEVE